MLESFILNTMTIRTMFTVKIVNTNKLLLLSQDTRDVQRVSSIFAQHNERVERAQGSVCLSVVLGPVWC